MISGCPLPGDWERATRNEGVGIALEGRRKGSRQNYIGKITSVCWKILPGSQSGSRKGQWLCRHDICC